MSVLYFLGVAVVEIGSSEDTTLNFQSMNAVILAIAIAAGLAVATVILLPATTSTTVENSFDAPVRAVWQVYTDFESQPNWRSDVAKVEMASDKTAQFAPAFLKGIIYSPTCMLATVLLASQNNRRENQTGLQGH